MAAGDIALNILLTANASSAMGVIGSMGQAIGMLASNPMVAAGVAATAAGAAMVGFGIKSVQAAGDFQGGMTSLVTSAGEAQSNIGMVGQGIQQMSIATGTSTQQLIQGMYMIESAGFHGAAGLQVLQAAAQGAKAENADLGVVGNAVTTMLTDYHMSADQAASATNALIATVSSGKTHLQDLSASMGSVLPLASSLGIAFPQVAGAIATMTNSGMDAQRASQNLANAIRSLAAPNSAATKSMKAVGLSAQDLHDTLTHQGLAAAIQEVTDAVGKKFPAGSVQAVTAFKSIMGGATGYNVALMLGGQNMAGYEDRIKSISGALHAGGTAVMGWSDIQNNFNFKIAQAGQALNVLMIALGTALLPMIGQLVGAITPVISAFANWIAQGAPLGNTLGQIGNTLNQVKQAFMQVFFPIQQVKQAVAPLLDTFDRGSAILHKTVAAAAPLLDTFDRGSAILHKTATAAAPLLDTFDRGSAILSKTATAAHSTTQALNPFVPIMQSIASVVRGFITVLASVNWVAVFQSLITVANNVWTVFKAIGGFLAANFAPVWQQLMGLWQAVIPLAHQLWSGLQAMMPLLIAIGLILGAVIVGALAAVIKGLAGFISGLIIVIQGIVQFVTGIFQVIGGLVAFFVDLFTGHFDKLQGDLGLIWQGIINIFMGAWTAIAGVFQTAWYLISGIVTGFIDGVIGFFTHLADMIVGHSIIPDMVKAIIQWFSNLVNQAISFIGNLVIGILTKFLQLETQAIAIVKQMVANYLAAIVSLEVQVLSTITLMVNLFLNWLDQMTGGGVTRVKNLVSQIVGVLGQLGSIATNAGQALMNGLIGGMQSMMGNLGNTLHNVVNFIGSFLPHSPAKQGELAHLNEYGPNLVKGIAAGITNSAPLLKNSMASLLAPVGNAFSVSGGSNAFALAAPSSTSNQPQTMNMQILLDGREITNVVGQRMSREMRIQGAVRSR